MGDSPVLGWSNTDLLRVRSCAVVGFRGPCTSFRKHRSSVRSLSMAKLCGRAQENTRQNQRDVWGACLGPAPAVSIEGRTGATGRVGPKSEGRGCPDLPPDSGHRARVQVIIGASVVETGNEGGCASPWRIRFAMLAPTPSSVTTFVRGFPFGLATQIFVRPTSSTSRAYSIELARSTYQSTCMRAHACRKGCIAGGPMPAGGRRCMALDGLLRDGDLMITSRAGPPDVPNVAPETHSQPKARSGRRGFVRRAAAKASDGASEGRRRLGS